MIIDKASIQFSNQHHFKQQLKETVSLDIRQTAGQSVPVATNVNQSISSAPTESNQPSAVDNLKYQLVKMMVKRLTGFDFELFSTETLQGNIESEKFQQPTGFNQNSSASFSLIYQQTSRYSEQESSSFSAQGQIQTQDGQMIDFSIKLNMNRSFYRESSVTIRADEAEKIDPLVINFEGKAAELSSTDFAFDLNADGIQEQIAVLKPTSGLLVLDKNEDGIINNGSELFGPQSASGFAELSEYDEEDDNDFIDETDSVYDSLQIWQFREDGSQQLYTLAEKNIGAIYLGHISTPFQLKTNDNRSLGEITDTGFYLTEDGNIGTVQQIDFIV